MHVVREHESRLFGRNGQEPCALVATLLSLLGVSTRGTVLAFCGLALGRA